MTVKEEYAYKNKYNKEKYDRMTIMLPKGKMEFYRSKAKEKEISLTAMIKDFLSENFDD